MQIRLYGKQETANTEPLESTAHFPSNGTETQVNASVNELNTSEPIAKEIR